MSEIIKPLFLDETGKAIVEALTQREMTKTRIAEINAAADAAKSGIETKTDEQVERITEVTALAEDVNQLKVDLDEFFTKEDTNIITANKYDKTNFVDGIYYSPSKGWCEREGYSCIKNIKIEPNKTYYANATDVIIFDSNDTKIDVCSSSINYLVSFITPSNADHIVLNYDGIPTQVSGATSLYCLTEKNGTQVINKELNPDVKIPGIGDISNNITNINNNITNINDKLNDLSTVPYLSKIEFDKLIASGTYGRMVNAVRSKFSNKGKTIYATNNSIGNFILPCNIDNWESLTFVLYAPYEAGVGTDKRGTLEVWLNNNGGHRVGFTGSMRYGMWSFVKIKKSDFYQDADINTISKLSFRVTPMETNQTHGFITLDSVFVDMKIKPTIAILFDHIWEESITNGAYDYLHNNGVPYTVASHNFSSMSESIIAEYDKLKLYGNDIGIYACYGKPNESVVHATTQKDAVDNLELAISDCVTNMGVRPVVYSATQGYNSEIMQYATRDTGFTMICGGVTNNFDDVYFENTNSIARRAEWETKSLDEIKSIIDKIVEYGSFYLFFTHGVCADGNAYMTVDGSLSVSSGIELTKFKGVIDYLSSLRNQGLIDLVLLRDIPNLLN